MGFISVTALMENIYNDSEINYLVIYISKNQIVTCLALSLYIIVLMKKGSRTNFQFISNFKCVCALLVYVNCCIHLLMCVCV